MKDKAIQDFKSTNDELRINVDMAIVMGFVGLIVSGGRIWGGLFGVAMSVGIDCLSHWEEKKFKPKNPTPQ